MMAVANRFPPSLARDNPGNFPHRQAVSPRPSYSRPAALCSTTRTAVYVHVELHACIHLDIVNWDM